MAAAFAGLPGPGQAALKAAVAFPFSYHGWNSVRHLVADTGNGLDIRDVYRGMYLVMAATGVSTAVLALAF